MKTLKLTLTLALFTICSSLAIAQNSPLTFSVTVVNEISGKPVDADIEWYDPSGVKRIERGKYEFNLGFDLEKTAIFSREGYFDSKIQFDYTTVKQKPDQEVRFQPSVPHLDITIQNAETQEVLTAAIDLFTLDESSIVFSEEVEIAPYTIDLEYDKVHVLQVRRPGFFSFKDTIDYKNVFDGRIRKKTVSLVPLKAGNKISLNNIYFKENEANLTDFAKLMLVELTHVLTQQPGLVIEVGAYTDDVGSDQFNKDLSERRAAAVKNYLVDKGAKPMQLQTRGYGETAPVVANINDANRALNRRVEFKIVKVQ